ncbi:bifunctional adenosylcobinamide kinase/adenosylcobinamide-phosphate guanylyltransferase [Litoreibacter roseus]|uniref:Bifunctional adenosylcobalamin biosynthesis protein n=1 Tax=Litoreibacter roseus TaxID=2601869 RepID=A0A6N6JAQ2_9RHOB|nr:bifunctional adenosylcobinamide kinase/adenosylcobinamide-phosphate guanylyltransferase [Litoreibacter roseus]GFE63321.1 adenosylcobinamide kinase/adenosylcobinamide phosphate guanyltransferase [Litoreibacter roseus]
MQKSFVTMVLGGASSGKSDFAEQIVIAQGTPRTYIATAQAFDPEMSSKIEAHRAARAGNDWTTVEAHIDLAAAVSKAAEGGVVLIDCTTLWLSNLLLAGADIEGAVEELLTTLTSTQNPVTLVCNEVGGGIVPSSKLGREFRAIQGRFNIKLAAQADRVVQVIAGLPQVLKGSPL